MAPKQKNNKLTVVLLNYRTPDLVIGCMQSLQSELTGIDAKCCVVDNDSQDDSAIKIGNWIEENHAGEKFYLLESDSNEGFSAGNNIGITNNSSDYYLLLNSDTYIRQGALKTLLKTADDNPKVGMVTPRLEWPDEQTQESCFRFPTPYSEMISAANTGVLTKLFKKYIVAIPVVDHKTDPQWTSFACVLIRQKLIDEIGLLDSDYFMYFEDIDYCFFARQAGWEIMNDPAARIVHLRGGSSSVKTNFKNKTRVPAYYMAARSRYFYKTGGRSNLLKANLAWYVGRTISKLRELFGHSKMVSDKQALDIWINWKNPGVAYKPNQ